MPFNEQRRKQLDQIVLQLAKKNAPKKDVDLIVNDFIQKYNEPVKIAPQKEASLLQKAGGVMDKASDFIFGSTAKTVGGLITGGIGAGANLYGMATGDKKAQEFGNRLQGVADKNITPGNTIWSAIELYPGGGFVTKALKKIPGGQAIAQGFAKIPEKIRAGAIKQYAEALGATTNELKNKTAKIAPQLLKQGITGSLDDLSKLSDEGMGVAGQSIKKAEDIISVFSKQQVAPLIEKANKLKSSYIINGKILDDSAVKSIDNTISAITQYGKEIPERQLIKIKRVLDKSISLANKNFTKEEGLSLATEAKQGIANTIRNTLNTKNPNLSKANAEFSLWADLNRVVGKTIERRSTQTGGLSRQIIPAILGGAGFATGGGIPAVIAYFATQKALQLFQSPAYKTISAVYKDRLANYLIKGNIKEATLLTTKLLSAIKNSVSEDK